MFFRGAELSLADEVRRHGEPHGKRPAPGPCPEQRLGYPARPQSHAHPWATRAAGVGERGGHSPRPGHARAAPGGRPLLKQPPHAPPLKTSTATGPPSEGQRRSDLAFQLVPHTNASVPAQNRVPCSRGGGIALEARGCTWGVITARSCHLPSDRGVTRQRAREDISVADCRAAAGAQERGPSHV